MWGGVSKMDTHASPLPQVAGRRVKSGWSIPPPPTWRPAKMTRQGPTGDLPGTRQDPPPITWPGERERGETRHFSKYSLINGYFKRPISQNTSAKLAPSLLRCQSLPISFLRAVRRENVPYIVTRAYIRPAKTTRHSQSATLHSTGNISAEGSEHQEQSRPQQHTWNSNLCYFSRWKYCCTQFTYSTSFMWTEVIDSRLL